MKICGLQKMTLLDYPGHVACTVFLGGCNYRCPYCHNFELATGEAEPLMKPEELMSFLEKRHGLLDGVAITGGEPCLQADLPDLIRQIKALGFKVKLDTNGAFPKMLDRLLSERLPDYVAMDIKNSPGRYAETVGKEQTDLAPVRESVRLLMASETEYEFRTTVVDELHTNEDILAIGKWIQGAKKYFLQRFTDRDTVPFEGFHAPGDEKMHRFLETVRPYVQHAELRGM